MNAFPLGRTKQSNEKIMAAISAVLIVYLLPRWIREPKDLISFIAVALFGLLIDVVANFVRYKKPICAVSAMVTASMLHILTPGVPLWGKLIGIMIALVIGKHIWGGTGKNPINPAMTGLIFLSLYFDLDARVFDESWLLLPAFLLSIPFIKFRPFAGTSLIVGMSLALILSNENLIVGLFSYGVIFWGCLVVTDPVTITQNPIIGSIGGLLSGFIPLMFFDSVFSIAVGILTLNVVSYLVEQFLVAPSKKQKLSLKMDRVVPYDQHETKMVDLVPESNKGELTNLTLSKEESLRRIQENGVFGCGGAAFSTYEKIKTVIEADAQERHLIINGVECDPGLIHDKWLLHHHLEEILKGIEVLNQCVNFNSITLAAKDIDNIYLAKDIKIQQVSDLYPIGAERILIKEVLNESLEHQVIPAQKGLLVLNLQTIYSIYQAVYKDEKVDSKYLTVANLKDEQGTSGVVAQVKLGACIQEVLDTVYPKRPYSQVFSGGGLMQSYLVDEQAVVDATTNFIAIADYPNYKESLQCTKCGLCSQNCPSGLKVNKIVDLVREKQLTKLHQFQPEKCFGCGACSYICLGGRNLSADMKRAKEYRILKNLSY